MCRYLQRRVRLFADSLPMKHSVSHIRTYNLEPGDMRKSKYLEFLPYLPFRPQFRSTDLEELLLH